MQKSRQSIRQKCLVCGCQHFSVFLLERRLRSSAAPAFGINYLVNVPSEFGAALEQPSFPMFFPPVRKNYTFDTTDLWLSPLFSLLTDEEEGKIVISRNHKLSQWAFLFGPRKNCSTSWWQPYYCVLHTKGRGVSFSLPRITCSSYMPADVATKKLFEQSFNSKRRSIMVNNGMGSFIDCGGGNERWNFSTESKSNLFMSHWNFGNFVICIALQMEAM